MKNILTIGVSEKNHRLERKLHLWNIDISLKQANEISNSICNQFNLEQIEIKFGKSKKYCGLYQIRIDKISQIFLYPPVGNNLATLCHELSHHYNSCIFEKSGHKEEFEKSHSILLKKIKELLSKNEIEINKEEI